MKIKLQYFVLLFIFISCSNNDDSDTEIEPEFDLPPQMEIKEEWKSLIIGKWEYIQQCEYGIQGGGCNESPSTSHYTFQTDSIVLYDNFINNCEEGIYGISGRNINFSFECINHEFDTEIHSLSDQYLIFVGTGDDSVVYRVYERVKQ